MLVSALQIGQWGCAHCLFGRHLQVCHQYQGLCAQLDPSQQFVLLRVWLHHQHCVQQGIVEFSLVLSLQQHFKTLLSKHCCWLICTRLTSQSSTDLLATMLTKQGFEVFLPMLQYVLSLCQNGGIMSCKDTIGWGTLMPLHYHQDCIGKSNIVTIGHGLHFISFSVPPGVFHLS